MQFLRFVTRFSVSGLLVVDSVQDPRNPALKSLEMKERLDTIQSVDASGQIYSGFATLLEISKRSKLPTLPLQIIRFCGFGDLLYRAMADFLKSRRCSQNGCKV
jgi:hypothetical protein